MVEKREDKTRWSQRRPNQVPFQVDQRRGSPRQGAKQGWIKNLATGLLLSPALSDRKAQRSRGSVGMEPCQRRTRQTDEKGGEARAAARGAMRRTDGTQVQQKCSGPLALCCRVTSGVIMMDSFGSVGEDGLEALRS